jgi:nicotinamidase-related amidase
MTDNKLRRLERNSCALVVVDLQTRLFSVMENREELLENSLKLISGIRVLNVPIIITEQYPKGIGPTIEPAVEKLGDYYRPISKVEFSCFGNDDFVSELKKLSGVTDLIIMGIEAHVCIFQTVLDALTEGYAVHIVSDAVSSRTKSNKDIGIKRCVSMGALLASTEMVLFQLLKTAGAAEFKEISKIVK